ESHIACERRDLWNPDDVLIKVAEHLVGGARDLVTIDAPGFAKEKQRTLLFVVTQCSNLASRKLVNGGIGKDQGEFEFSDSEPEHIEGNRAAGPHRGEDLAESLSVFSYGVDSPEHLVANVNVAAGEMKASHLDPLGWRNEGLGIKQVGEVRKTQALGRRKREPRAIIERIIRQ